MAMESKHLRLYFIAASIISGGVWSWNLGGALEEQHIFFGGDKIEIHEIFLLLIAKIFGPPLSISRQI